MPDINDIAPGKTIEEIYLEHNWSIGAAARVERMFDLSASVRNMVFLQIQRENPGLTERQLLKKTAERIYMGDPRVLKLLREAEDR